MPCITMPWGKHKGVPVNLVPTSYLVWCCLNVERWDGTLKQAVHDELRKREVEPPSFAVRQESSSSEVEMLKQKIQGLELVIELMRRNDGANSGVSSWKKHYRRLSMLCHPDRGGSHELMALLNEVNEEMTGS